MGAPKARYVHRVRMTSDGRLMVGTSIGPLTGGIVYDDEYWANVPMTVANVDMVSWRYVAMLTLPELRRVCRYIIGDGGELTSKYRDKRSLRAAVSNVFTVAGVSERLKELGNSGARSLGELGYLYRDGVVMTGGAGGATHVPVADPEPTPSPEPEPEPVNPWDPEPTTAVSEPTADLGSLLGGFAEALRPIIQTQVNAALEMIDPVGPARFDDLATELTAKVNDVVANIGVPISVTWEPPHGGDPQTKTGVHHLTPTLAKRVQAGIPMLLHGEAGTGKTTMAHHVADMLGLQVELLPCDEGMMRHDAMGYMDANGLYHAPETRRAFENGLMLVLDEFDAPTANFAVSLNALIERDRLSFPDGIVERHPDFRVIACTNTIGEGATAQYRGRNGLDAATLNRFTFMHVPLDESIETAMVHSVLADRAMCDSWLRVVRTARKNVRETGLRVLVTPRSALDGAKLLALGEPMTAAVRDRLTRGCSMDVAEKLLSGTGISVAEVI